MVVNAGITPPVSQTMRNGDVVSEIDGHAFTISHMIEGQHPQVVNEDLVTEFGRVLARFHNATQQLDIAGSSWLSEPTISQEIAAVDDPNPGLRARRNATRRVVVNVQIKPGSHVLRLDPRT